MLCGETDTAKQLLKARIAVQAFELGYPANKDKVADTRVISLLN